MGLFSSKVASLPEEEAKAISKSDRREVPKSTLPKIPSHDYSLPSHISPKDCMKFIPPVKFCRVIKVYDGDTVTIATKFPQFHPTDIFKFQVRLNGIDAPEIKGKTTEEKLAALNSRDKLHTKIMNKDVELRNLGFEKYGR
jgi:endonuclease YncB( thermonuclease family)